MEQNKISQHLKNKQKKEKSPQRKLQGGLWEKTEEGVVSWTQRGMFQRRPSQP